MSGEGFPNCPFCGFRADTQYAILFHVETMHSEFGDSPFTVKDEPSTIANGVARKEHASGTSTPSELEYIECPHHCGEQILASELQLHVDLHVAEGMALDDAGDEIEDSVKLNVPKSHSLPLDFASRRSGDHSPDDRQRKTSWRDLFMLPKKRRESPVRQTKTQGGHLRRLGKAELGPFAHEKRMPSWLIKLLEDGGQTTVSNKIGPDGRLMRVEAISNETPNLVPVLARLSKLDPNISKAFYCDPRVQHITKLPKEGGFCGYRNIQMLISYIQGAHAPGYQRFRSNRIPSILRLQEMIESAWDMGFNATGREETGGIRLTRKYIGTPEAQALLLSVGVAAEAMAFNSDKKGDAYPTMMRTICQYFDDEANASNDDKVIIMDKPPLFLQHQGHSMTIVGVEIDVEGQPNLVVFDPMYNVHKRLKDMALLNVYDFQAGKPARLMKLHRRDGKHLEKYKAFEMIKINGPV